MTTRLPIVEELTPRGGLLACFEELHGCAGAILLDSSLPMASVGRYSYFSAFPFLTLTSRGTDICVRRYTAGDEDGDETFTGDPFAALASLLATYRLAPRPGLPPFQGGAAGYFAYDLGRRVERIPVLAQDDLDLPEMHLGFYDVVVAQELASGHCFLISTGLPATGARAAERARERLAFFRRLLETAAGPSDEETRAGEAECVSEAGRAGDGFQVRGELRANFTREEYERAVERVRQYIGAGDIFQANLSQRFEIDFAGDPFALYLKTRVINPSPFAAYLHTPEVDVVSASPERFLRVEEEWVQSRPIKGRGPAAEQPERTVVSPRNSRRARRTGPRTS